MPMFTSEQTPIHRYRVAYDINEFLTNGTIYIGDGGDMVTISTQTETADRFGAPYIAVIGNNSAMNQIRYGQLTKYGEQRGNIGNKLGDMEFSYFPQQWDAWGVEVREPRKIAPALRQAREQVAETGKSPVINIWVDPNEYAPGTKAQTM
jgi:acetolactate synthase I/II/III large subunit